jgi:diphosphomevalonate decarboxylase
MSRTSPYYDRWTEIAASDFTAARDAVANRDFARLADVAEANCLAMHAVMLSARPPLVYWTGATVECIRSVQALRSAGTPVFFTIDAGPQVKAVCEPGAVATVRAAFEAIPSVKQILTVGLGGPARLLSAS